MVLGPGSPGLTALFAVLALSVLAGYVAVPYWLYCDARVRGSKRPVEWVLNWLLFNWFAVAYYLLVRDRLGERTAPVTTRERGAPTVAFGLLLALLAGTVLTPPDPLTQLAFVLLSLFVTLPLTYAALLAVDRLRTTAA